MARRRGRWLLYCVGGLVVLLVVASLLADPIATRATRRALSRLEGFSGDFADVEVSLIPLAYEVSNLKIVEQPARSGEEPLFFARSIRSTFSLLELVRGRFVGSVRVESPKVSYGIHEPVERELEEAQEKVEEPWQALSRAFADAPALKLERAEVFDGELLVTDYREPEAPRIWLHAIDLTLENFASNRALSNDRAATLALSSTVQESGTLSLYVSADPLALPPRFAGQLKLVDLQLRDLHELITSKADIEIPKGEYELFATFRAEEGRLSGGVKPILRGVEVAPEHKGLGEKIKASLANAALSLLESSPEEGEKEGEKVATVIPIRGDLSRPEVQLTPTVLGVIRNAFVEGLAAGFQRLPPPVADEEQSVLKQAVDALQPKKEAPKAQPQGTGGAGDSGSSSSEDK